MPGGEEGGLERFRSVSVETRRPHSDINTSSHHKPLPCLAFSALSTPQTVLLTSPVLSVVLRLSQLIDILLPWLSSAEI